MPIFVTVMLALCNACWEVVLSGAAMLIKHVLCLVFPTDTTLTSGSSKQQNGQRIALTRTT